MTLLRRHIWSIVVYLFGFILLKLAGTLVLLYSHPPMMLFETILGLLMPVSSLAPLIVVLPLFYRRADIGRKAEWAVLAPALMAGLILGTCWNSVSLIVDWLPPGPAPASYFVIRCLINSVFLFGTSMLCVALVARYMSRPQPGCPRAGHWRQNLAVLAMVVVVSLAATIAKALADAMHWGIGETLEEVFQTGYLRSVLIGGASLLAITVTWIVTAHLLLRRTDELSRWSAMAAIAAWVALVGWMPLLFHTFFPWFDFASGYAPFASDPYAEVELFVRLFLTRVLWGAAAGVLAILYARLVAYRIGLKKWGYTRPSSKPVIQPD